MTLLPTPTWDTFLRTVSTRTNGTWLFRGQAGKNRARREVTDRIMEKVAELCGQEKAGW